MDFITEIVELNEDSDGGTAGIPDESKFENVKAMIDATNKYGVYRK